MSPATLHGAVKSLGSLTSPGGANAALRPGLVELSIFGVPRQGSGLQVPHSHSAKMAPPAGDAGTVFTRTRSNAPSGVSVPFLLAPLQTSIRERFLFNVVPV